MELKDLTEISNKLPKWFLEKRPTLKSELGEAGYYIAEETEKAICIHTYFLKCSLGPSPRTIEWIPKSLMR